MSSETFLWYDFETFGADPRRDRPAQFGAIRTDTSLEQTGEPLVIYCRPTNDLLPNPDACLITGITPQIAEQRGIPENEFALRIFELMTQPGTCSVGYNNFRFDDEVTRWLFWRNFLDPYQREYANGNSRLDLIDILRMTRALRPEGIDWPDHEDGRPSFRLEDIASANGFDTSRAHDALADVEATIGMARLLATRQPRIWQWALKLRDRQAVERLLAAREPLLHSSSRYPSMPGCNTAAVLPLAGHPVIRSQWLVWNLDIDPEPYLDLDADELADRYWTAASDLPDGIERVPIKLVRSNRCPMLSPLGVLDQASTGRLQIDPDRIEQHAATLLRQPQFIDRLTELFARRDERIEIDAELDLYGGFPPPADQRLFSRIRASEPEQLTGLGCPFADERLNELLFRYRARLWPHTLDADEQARWDDYRRRRLLSDPELASIQWTEYRQRVNQLLAEPGHDPEFLQDLLEWPERIEIARLSGADNQ